MKRRHRVATFALGIIVLAGAIGIQMVGCSGASARRDVSVLSGVETEYNRKFTDESKAYLTALAPDEDPFVKITFRTLGTLTAERKEAIDATGIQVDSLIGDVTSAVGRARTTLALAELEYVSYIDVQPPVVPPHGGRR